MLWLKHYVNKNKKNPSLLLVEKLAFIKQIVDNKAQSIAIEGEHNF